MNTDFDALPSLPLCSPAERYTYHVVSSAAPMGGAKFGVYKRVAVVEVDHHERPIGFVPERIAAARGVKVVWIRDRCSVGTTDACAYRVALRSAERAAADARNDRAEDAARDAGEIVEISRAG